MFAAILICLFLYFFLFKQKTAYEMRISDWSSDVCSSDLRSWRIGRNVLVRTDSGGGTHEFLDYCHRRRLGYSIGFTLTDDIVTAMDTHLSDRDWAPAYDADGQVRPGAWVVEVTGITELSGWPPGMRLLVRKERPHPGAQLRFTDRDGLRLTAFVTNTSRGQLPDLELRHRRRARCEEIGRAHV